MAKNKIKFTVPEIIDLLRKEEENETIEGKLLKPKYIRELYKQLGDPDEKDFPEECRIAGRYWKKVDGYTTNMCSTTKRMMEHDNAASTDWHIKYPSATKVRIVENYTKAGWHCRVQAYNVMCSKYVEHPRYKNLGVEFYSSRDCNKYEYFIIRDEEDE